MKTIAALVVGLVVGASLTATAFVVAADPPQQTQAVQPAPEARSGPESVLLTTPTGQERWSLSWGDEFDGEDIDNSKWTVADNSNFGSANSEDQCYRSENVAVEDGHLVITVRRETVECGGTNPDTGSRRYHFTSGMVTNRRDFGADVKFKGKYGYYEAAIKNPKGNPFWSGWWLVGANDGSAPPWPEYGEFDISEVVGILPETTFGTAHFGCLDGSGRPGGHCKTAANNYNIAKGDSNGSTSNYGTELTSENLDSFTGPTSQEAIAYGLLWAPDRLTWYVDRQPVRFLDGQTGQVHRINPDGSLTEEERLSGLSPSLDEVFAYEHSMIINQAVGGRMPSYYGYSGEETSTGYDDGNLAAVFPATLEVDYVRYYGQGEQ